MPKSVIIPSIAAPIALAGALASASAQRIAPVYDTTMVIATSARLTVRPHEMATATETKEAGTLTIPGVRGFVYVPRRCLGKTRVPLYIDLNGGGVDPGTGLAAHSWFADQYGIILFVPGQFDEQQWDVIAGPNTDFSETEYGLLVHSFEERDVRNIDSGMKYILRHFAIDPNRIALAGGSDGGAYTYFLGTSNPDIFSRVAPGSAATPLVGQVPKNSKAQFFISGGLDDGMSGTYLPHLMLKMAEALRQEGLTVKTVMRLGGHVEEKADDSFLLEWMFKSWAEPSITTAVPPIDSDAVLTGDAVQRMTTFWTRFRKEPDSILAGRDAHKKEVYLLIAGELTSTVFTDMSAMAAQYPSVAADLQAAGLTAKEEDAYRTAMIRVRVALAAGAVPGAPIDTLPFATKTPYKPISPTSVFGKNIAFRQAHDAEFEALGETGMWTTP